MEEKGKQDEMMTVLSKREEEDRKWRDPEEDVFSETSKRKEPQEHSPEQKE